MKSTSETAAVVAAILAGFGALAIVVWVASQRIVAALSEVSRSATMSASQAVSIPATSPVNNQVAAPASTPSVTVGDLELKARDQVQDAITAATSEYRRACARERVRGMLEFELAFDAAGVEQTRTVRGFGPDVTEALLACLRKQKLPPLHVQAVGHPITLTANTQL